MFALPGVRSRRLAVVVVTMAVVAVAVGCGTSGRSMQAPEPGATAPPRRPDPTTSTTGPPFNVADTLFSVTSTAFDPGGEIPSEYTCDDVGNAPPFTWTNVPPGTVELALVVTDPDAGGFVHWMIAGIDPATTSLGPRFAPAGSVELANSNGTPTYAPLCPPVGELHTYDVTLYALDKPSGLTAQSDTTDALTSLATTAIGTAVLTGSYTRNTAN